jgi:hypothetical protein
LGKVWLERWDLGHHPIAVTDPGGRVRPDPEQIRHREMNDDHRFGTLLSQTDDRIAAGDRSAFAHVSLPYDAVARAVDHGVAAVPLCDADDRLTGLEGPLASDEQHTPGARRSHDRLLDLDHRLVHVNDEEAVEQERADHKR